MDFLMGSVVSNREEKVSALVGDLQSPFALYRLEPRFYKTGRDFGHSWTRMRNISNETRRRNQRCVVTREFFACSRVFVGHWCAGKDSNLRSP